MDIGLRADFSRIALRQRAVGVVALRAGERLYRCLLYALALEYAEEKRLQLRKLTTIAHPLLTSFADARALVTRLTEARRFVERTRESEEMRTMAQLLAYAYAPPSDASVEHFDAALLAIGFQVSCRVLSIASSIITLQQQRRSSI